MKLRIAVLVFASALYGCGDTSNISGKVLDGYISKATIFWDCNLNGQLDAGELSVTSTPGGSYEIEASPKAGCRLTAYISADSIDEDTGTSVLAPYVMMALDSNPTIISPLTTLAVMDGVSANQTVAAENIKSKFALKLRIDTDYLQSTPTDYVDARKYAKVTAQLLQGNYSAVAGYSPSTYSDISKSIDGLKDKIAAASVADLINKSAIDFTGLLKGIFHIFYADPTLGVKVNDYQLSASQVSYLKSLIADSRVTPYIGSGRIAWTRLDLATLENINSKLNTNGFVSSASPSLLTTYSARYTAVNTRFADLIQGSNSVVTLDSESIAAIFDVGAAALKGGYGVAKMASVVPNVSGVFNKIKMTPGAQGALIRNLNNLSKYTDFLKKTAECGVSIKDFLAVFNNGDEITPEAYLDVMKGVGKLVGCMGSYIDEAPAGKGIGYFVDLFTAGSATEDEKLDAAVALLDALNIVISLTPPTPFSNFVSGFLDLVGAGLDSYKAGLTIAKQAGKKFDVLSSDLQKLQDKQLAMLKQQYLAQSIDAKIGYGVIRADWPLFTPPIIDPNASNSLTEDFNGTAVDTTKWNIDGAGDGIHIGPVSVANGLAEFGAWGRISTKAKVTFSGSKIIIEARMAGQGGSRDTSIQLVDSVSGDYIYSGDTSYFGEGFFAAASGAYNFTQREPSPDVPSSTLNVVRLGGSTNQFMEYRWTLDGDKFTMERGPTLNNITQTATRTLGRSIVGRSFYLSIGTASPDYSPGTWDWVRVSTDTKTSSSTGQLTEDFNGSSIATSNWTSVGFSRVNQPIGSVTVSGGIAEFAAWGRLNTKGKFTISGQKIIIEARMKGVETNVLLFDSATEDAIILGESSYCSWGFYANAGGPYRFKATSAGGCSNGEVLASGVVTTDWMEYRFTVDGSNLKIERGPTLSNITETYSATLGQSISGRSFYLDIGTGGTSLSPASFDWIRASAQ